MKTKQRMEITIETHQQTLIRSCGKTFVAWCDVCRTETLLLKPEQAAAIYGIAQREIFRRIENGELHFTETNMSGLFICSNSLENKIYKIQRV